jgi:glutamate dehydrogenase
VNTKVEAAKAALVDQAVAAGRGRLPEEFLRRYWERVAPEDVVGRSPVDLHGAALAHHRLGERRPPGTAVVAVYNPSFEDHGWVSTHSVVQAVTDDMPFLVDSVSLALSSRGIGMHLVVHPVVDDVAYIHVEIDRQGEAAEIEALREAVLDVLAQVRAAVEDWPVMRSQALSLAAELQERPPPADPDAVAEARDFLRWLADDNFVFLGYCEYELAGTDGSAVLRSVPGRGAGLLRDGDMGSLPPEPPGDTPITLTRSSSLSPVHRPGPLDSVGLTRYGPDGRVTGEDRFLGLYTSSLQHTPAGEVPVLRRTVAAVIDRAGFAPRSHDAKALVDVLEAYSRRELFEMTADELFTVATGILDLSQRQRVRLFARQDRFGRFWSCLVFVPLDRYTQAVRRRITDILLDAFGGHRFEYAAHVGDSVLARLHFVIHTGDGGPARPAPDLEIVESRIAAAARSWADDLAESLLDQHGEQRGLALLRRYGEAFPAAYQDDYPARVGCADIARIEALDHTAATAGIAVALTPPLHGPDGELRFKVLRRGSPVSLSDVMPILDHMGVSAVDQRPYEVTPAEQDTVWIHDFGLRAREGWGDAPREVFTDAFAAVWRGAAENDGFNRLVLSAGLEWGEVAVLRAYARYMRQTGSTFSLGYMESVLVANRHVARLLVELFRARFDPAVQPDPDDAASLLTKRLEEAIDATTSLDEDRILRSFLALVQATLRTNFFSTGPARLAFKLDPSLVPDLPLPRPRFEIFVCSPQVEGVHLRGGKVSRGGIRWSERKEDFRTEILGLMKAQMVKNAVIVPVGAKGGFVVKAAANPSRDDVAACYRAFISACLDLTDNIVGTETVRPVGVVAYDEDDAYLVVAADKGTATFSDLANEVAAEHGFWLGDAFASGGSAGYDHKAMGITARGAWESVRRHFRHLGVDADTAPLTVVGIGDMSGDVFGNGLLSSPHLKLVAAFDHRHIFLDPDPDPEQAYAERRRLFELPRSSWADYDPALISAGGGVWPRTAKAVPLSAAAQAVLGTDAVTLSPPELIRAILRAPVDLLWNGGIGTYVKATSETHAEVGDKANDGVRVDAAELRARVVGEGGNLGFTQRARVEFALAGGRINTDAIDNSAGVDCSDHEVNIKVLLDAVVADGDLTGKQRNQLLADMTDDVAAMVLGDNYDQTGALALALHRAADMADVHARQLRHLEATGKLDRALEFLPGDETLIQRQTAGTGLTAPEFAVLLAYTKNDVAAALAASDAPDDPWLARELTAYFPPALRDERFQAARERHPLRREIVATCVTNTLVDRAGTSFVFRLTEETGASVADLARAHAAARELFGLDAFWAEVEALDGQVPAEVQVTLALEARLLAERASRWLIRHVPPPLAVAAVLEHFSAGLADLVPHLRDGDGTEVAAWVEAGVPAPLAVRAATLRQLPAALEMVDVHVASERPTAEVAATWYALGEVLELDWLRDRIVTLPADGRWTGRARTALRDDCERERAQLVAEVLGAPGGLEGWLADHEVAVARFLSLVDEIRVSASGPDVSTLSVAMREVRALSD